MLDRAIALMERHIEEPLSCAVIARHASRSPRRMQRPFTKSLGARPARHDQLIRLSKAHAVLQQTDLSVAEIASARFGSLEHVCRIYRHEFERRPRDDRRQSIAAPVFRRSASGLYCLPVVQIARPASAIGVRATERRRAIH